MLRLLITLATQQQRSPPDDAAPPPAPPLLAPAAMLSAFCASAGTARHVLLTARRRVTPDTPLLPSALPRLAVPPRDVTLVLRNTIPDTLLLNDDLLARASRLELHDLAPSHAQLQALGQRCTPSHLRELALINCTLPDPSAEQQHGPAFASASIRSLEVLGCQVASRDEAQPKAARRVLPAAAALLRASGVRRLDTDAEHAGGADLPALLPALTHLCVRSHLSGRSLDRALLEHPALRDVELLRFKPSAKYKEASAASRGVGVGQDGQVARRLMEALCPEIDGGEAAAGAAAEGPTWRRVVVDGSDGEGLADALPLGRIRELVLRGGVGLRASGPLDPRAWERLEAAAEVTGTAIVCEPSASEDGTFALRCEADGMGVEVDEDFHLFLADGERSFVVSVVFRRSRRVGRDHGRTRTRARAEEGYELASHGMDEPPEGMYMDSRYLAWGSAVEQQWAGRVAGLIAFVGRHLRGNASAGRPRVKVVLEGWTSPLALFWNRAERSHRARFEAALADALPPGASWELQSASAWFFSRLLARYS